MDIQRMMELYAEGKTDPEIANIMGVSRALIQIHRSKLGLKSNFTYKSFRKMDYDTVAELVKQNKTDREIAGIFGVKPVSVYFFRKRNHIERDNLLFNKAIEPTERQWSIIIGTLLGDASLRKNGTANPTLSCEHGIRQKEYCYWKFKELESLGGSFNISKRKIIDIRTGIYYESAVLRLRANPALLPIYNDFYKDGKKVIPTESLNRFTELSLAVLFMDDGSRATNTVTIATNCFSEDDLVRFIEFLKSKFNLTFHIMKSHVLYLLRKDAMHFKELVLPYMNDTLLYKLSHVTP